MIWWITAISWKYVHALKFLRQYLSRGKYLLTTQFMRDWSRQVRLENTWVRLWQFGHLVRHKLQAIPQCVTKHYRKSDYFTGCRIESLMLLRLVNWVRNNDTSSCCHCPPLTPQQESNAPNTKCKSSVEHDSKDCQTSPYETHQDLTLQGVYILNYQTFFLDSYLTCMKHKCRYN